MLKLMSVFVYLFESELRLEFEYLFVSEFEYLFVSVLQLV